MSLLVILSFLAAPALQVWLAMLLVRRSAHRYLRFFFSYTIFSIAAGVLKFVVRGNPRTYFYSAWSAEAVYVVLGFAAIYEVFRHVFHGFYGYKWFKFLLPGVSLLMLVPSVWWVSSGPIKQPDPAIVVVLSAEIVVRCVQAGVFLVIFGLAKFFSMQWRRYDFGIAAGFFVSAFGLVLTVLIRSEFGKKYGMLLYYTPIVAYILAVLIWLASFWRPQRDPFEDVRHLFTPELFMEQLERQRKQLRDLLKPWLSLIYSRFTWP